jgi:hypothetical protein
MKQGMVIKLSPCQFLSPDLDALAGFVTATMAEGFFGGYPKAPNAQDSKFKGRTEGGGACYGRKIPLLLVVLDRLGTKAIAQRLGG